MNISAVRRGETFADQESFDQWSKAYTSLTDKLQAGQRADQAGIQQARSILDEGFASSSRPSFIQRVVGGVLRTLARPFKAFFALMMRPFKRALPPSAPPAPIGPAEPIVPAQKRVLPPSAPPAPIGHAEPMVPAQMRALNRFERVLYAPYGVDWQNTTDEVPQDLWDAAQSNDAKADIVAKMSLPALPSRKKDPPRVLPWSQSFAADRRPL